MRDRVTLVQDAALLAADARHDAHELALLLLALGERLGPRLHLGLLHLGLGRVLQQDREGSGVRRGSSGVRMWE